MEKHDLFRKQYRDKMIENGSYLLHLETLGFTTKNNAVFKILEVDAEVSDLRHSNGVFSVYETRCKTIRDNDRTFFLFKYNQNGYTLSKIESITNGYYKEEKVNKEISVFIERFTKMIEKLKSEH